MNRKAMVALLPFLLSSLAGAEPVFLPQAASVVKQKQFEAGVSAQSGYQKSEITNSPGTTFVNRVWSFPIWARYGVTDTIESHLTVPIVRAIDSSEGTASTRNSDSGIGNMQIGAKWNFKPAPLPLALGVDLDLPTANPKNNPGALGQRYSTQLQQGLNAHVFFAADTPAWNDLLTGHATVGYMNTATYTTPGGSRFNPSDLMTFGASVDLDMKKWVGGLSGSLDFVGNTALNHSKTGGTTNGSDKGTVLEVGPALRYQMGSWRTHAGVLFDEGKATFRAYTFRTAFGVSYLFGASR